MNIGVPILVEVLTEKGLKLHIENAIGYGATAQEILEVMEIASVLRIHAVTTAVPILLEEAAAFKKD
jgi:alkylhydroperoxidase/carboxymuconolactone decarboxylase family protein YurZ